MTPLLWASPVFTNSFKDWFELIRTKEREPIFDLVKGCEFSIVMNVSLAGKFGLGLFKTQYSKTLLGVKFFETERLVKNDELAIKWRANKATTVNGVDFTAEEIKSIFTRSTQRIHAQAICRANRGIVRPSWDIPKKTEKTAGLSPAQFAGFSKEVGRRLQEKTK